LVFALLAPAPVSAQEMEARTISGAPLVRPHLPEDFRAKQEAYLGEAQKALAANTDDADAAIWVGRRLGYLGRYQDAIALYQAGAARHADDARFLRHLGHRFITVRRTSEAIGVLEAAAALMAARPDEIEPDGLPNAAGIPTSTLKGNIYYHLGLAYYLKNDFEKSAAAFGVAAALAGNSDSAAASRYWLYLARMRAGDPDGAKAALAPVSADWKLIENADYHRLALCFKGAADCAALLGEARAAEGVAGATLLYGLAAHAMIAKNRAVARDLVEEIIARDDWASFGHIAAEADVAEGRVKGRP
jgi:tetratricopeptide (TPR) repeat protein